MVSCLLLIVLLDDKVFDIDFYAIIKENDQVGNNSVGTLYIF